MNDIACYLIGDLYDDRWIVKNITGIILGWKEKSSGSYNGGSLLPSHCPSRRKNEFSRKRVQSSNHSTLAFRPFSYSAWPVRARAPFHPVLRITKIVLRNKIFNYCRLQMYRSTLLSLSLSTSFSFSLARIKSNNLFSTTSSSFIVAVVTPFIRESLICSHALNLALQNTTALCERYRNKLRSERVYVRMVFTSENRTRSVV